MHALQHRVVGGFAVRFLLGIGDARQGKQVVAFGRAEPQRFGDACQRIGEIDTSRPCSIQVYQVALMPLICASSSRRRPLVRRREELGRPIISGVMRSRCARRNAPRAFGPDKASDDIAWYLFIPG